MTYTTDYEKRDGKVYPAAKNTGTKKSGNNKQSAPAQSGTSTPDDQNSPDKTGE